tara:strand:+ start:1327 stop:2001 length:675 start_codon:yes stop_codon:yes gene_type:complete
MYDYNTIELIKKIKNDYPNRWMDVLNSLGERQQLSKDWLIEKLNSYKHPFRNKFKKDRISIMVLCSWYGLMAYKLIEKFKSNKIKRIHCVDYDPKAKRISNKLFRKIDDENLKNGVLTLIKHWERDIIDMPEKEFKDSEILINTSCEHLNQQTIYDTIDKTETGTLIVLQSNNYHKIQEHINTVKDLQEFVSQYQSRLINIEMYEKDFLEYKRFMILGLKRCQI